MAALADCGTWTAYKRHVRNKEPVDDACAQAARDQKNVRKDAERQESADLVALALSVEQTVEQVSDLDDALENLRIVRAAMQEAPANAVAALSKRREDLVSRIARLQTEQSPEVSVVDQLRQRREARLSAS